MTMELLTWNIQWGRGCDGRVDLARIARAAREAANPSVICLQEVAINFAGLPGSAGEDQLALLRDAFPDYQAFYGAATDLPDGRAGRSQFGNLILSRLPVLQVFRHLLPWPADPAVSSMQRICVEAVVCAPFGPLRVMTTHLEYYSALQRIAQVDALRALHAQGYAHARHPRSDQERDSPFAVVPRGEFALVCGDFNFTPSSAEHERMQSATDDGTPRLVDAWTLAHPGVAHAHTVGLHECDWPDEPYCCDFVFVSDNLAPRVRAVEVLSATDASDHQPVRIEFAD
jgi:endonuclease/exonuclease/phosphatase family metal-dependent hydrolase